MTSPQVLLQLHRRKAQIVTECKRRASVALVLRVREGATRSAASSPPSLEAFLAQPWVRDGSLECLFIRRATRPSDRWSNHIALPGGKQDPDDGSDEETARRETLEEVGLDLAAEAWLVGRIDDRLVKSNWGQQTLMTLCPFVYILSSPSLPELVLSQGEIAAAYWVAVEHLLHPQPAFEYVDVSNRVLPSAGTLVRSAIRAMLGKMMFAAIELRPTTSIPVSIPSRPLGTPVLEESETGRLMLWGLTYGVMIDFLSLYSRNAFSRWQFPTFTAPDVRLWVWLATRSHQRRERTYHTTHRTMNAVGEALEDYYPKIRRAVLYAMLSRLTILLYLAWRVSRSLDAWIPAM